MAGQLGTLTRGARLRPWLMGPDNDVLTVSGAFGGQPTAATASTALRKKTSTGHVLDTSSAQVARMASRRPLGRRTAGALLGRPTPRSDETVPAPPSKLKVLVRLDVDMGAAHIQIRGNVTDRNLEAVHVVARRACALTRESTVVLDLRHALVGARPMAELQLASVAGELPPTAGSPSMPCRLDILEPAAA